MAQPKASVARGKRVHLEPLRERDLAPATYVCGHKPLDFGEHVLTAGVEVPGAAGWTRIDAWTGARRIRKIAPGEKFISFAEFTAAPAE